MGKNKRNKQITNVKKERGKRKINERRMIINNIEMIVNKIKIIRRIINFKKRTTIRREISIKIRYRLEFFPLVTRFVAWSYSTTADRLLGDLHRLLAVYSCYFLDLCLLFED